MSLVRLAARPMLAAPFIWTGLERLRNPKEAAAQLEGSLNTLASVTPKATVAANQPELVARVLGGVQVVAGSMFAIGRMPRFSSAVLVGTALINALAEAQAEVPEAEKLPKFLKNIGLAGGVLLASVDTAGNPSLAWRAQHLAQDAKKTFEKTNAQVTNAVRSTTEDARKRVEDTFGI
ncbi:DoxX family protein [Neomicrococcus lactis]|uniref:Putative membrane protein YphA (DoxX/SURF4 family) n=1 Tax=Neomicrococcus lactis TaxID=732241 RepID=A0A7W9DB22_9MICC|nr:DoxX family protein [Neomicrococcus lactis]MBB5597397.1 putative membrane protein YphA (DoxX/SURF4 family) [Neomicrococcus lactis]